MYTIFVRDLPGHDPETITALAIDVPNASTASELVRNIATSYPVHLADPFDTAYWFKDEQGCHEIWYENVQVCSKCLLRETVPSESSARMSRSVAYERAEPFPQPGHWLRTAA